MSSDISDRAARFDQAAKAERLEPPQMIQKDKAARYPITGIKIFKVQSAATGDGVYNCNEQKLDSTEWNDTAGDDKFDDKDTTEEEVLNLLENNTEATYKEALAKYDKIKAWKMTDDEGTSRWVGVPLVGAMVRRARTTQAAPSDTKITANLYDNTGAEITSGLGSGINVYCDTNGGGNLNVSVPLLKNLQTIFVINIQGKWWCMIPFNTGQSATAYVKTIPGAVTSLSCWFSETDGTGQTITVPCVIVGGGKLNGAVPLLTDGKKITVRKNGSNWNTPITFDSDEECNCYSA
jgi:hypothetical protein